MFPENILSIDVEEWFHYEYFLRHDPPKTFRLPKVIPALLNILSKRNTRATFFCVGEVARDQPEIIESIHEAGHEIGSHNYVHKPLWEFSDREVIESDLRKSILLTRKLTGKAPKGYRAPYFSIDKRNPWMINSLESLGFKYDASLFPRKTPLYGAPEAPLGKYQPSRENRHVINTMKMPKNRYGMVSEFVANVARSKLTYAEVPIKTIYIGKEAGMGIKDAFKSVLSMLTWRLRRW